jgi:hypothetical protein
MNSMDAIHRAPQWRSVEPSAFSESHDADVDAAVHAADKRLLKNTRKSRDDGEPILHGLSLRPRASDAHVTPAMEAGIADHVWSIEEIVNLLGG